jgi:hypothetical protein
VVVEIDIVIDPCSGLIKGGGKMSVNTFGLKNGKEIFSHSIVVTVSSS